MLIEFSRIFNDDIGMEFGIEKCRWFAYNENTEISEWYIGIYVEKKALNIQVY